MRLNHRSNNKYQQQQQLDLLIYYIIILISTVSLLTRPICTLELKFDDVVLKKPYVQVCDEEVAPELPPPPPPDQTRPECPLPLNSSSLDTGCMCHFDSSRIECIYSNRLVQLPPFSFSNSNPTNQKQQYEIVNATISKKDWSIDLRCKNFTFLENFKWLVNLTHLTDIDLSGLGEKEYFEWCKSDMVDGRQREIRYLEKVRIFTNIKNEEYYIIKNDAVLKF